MNKFLKRLLDNQTETSEELSSSDSDITKQNKKEPAKIIPIYSEQDDNDTPDYQTG